MNFFFISIGYKSVRNFSLKNTQIEYLAKIISDLLNPDYKRQCTYNMSSPTFLYNSSCHSFCKRSTRSGWFYWYWLWNNLRSMYISWWWWCTLSDLFSMFLPPILYINSRKVIKSKQRKCLPSIQQKCRTIIVIELKFVYAKLNGWGEIHSYEDSRNLWFQEFLN